MSAPTCRKAPHDNPDGGYLHGEDDDTPYDVDGALYCGRCHYACNPDTRRCENPRAVESPAALSIRQIQTVNQARSDRWMGGSPGWTVLEVAGELAGEVGELANVCKKLRRSEMGVPGNKQSDAELREMASSEIADVFIVLMLTASKLGIDVEDAVRVTFNRKSEQMGFPERIPERRTQTAGLPNDPTKDRE